MGTWRQQARTCELLLAGPRTRASRGDTSGKRDDRLHCLAAGGAALEPQIILSWRRRERKRSREREKKRTRSQKRTKGLSRAGGRASGTKRAPPPPSLPPSPPNAAPPRAPSVALANNKTEAERKGQKIVPKIPLMKSNPVYSSK